jgi:hypothetical protein
MTFVQFVRRLEGKPEIPKVPEVVFPRVWNLADFRYVCLRASLEEPGSILTDQELKNSLFDGFRWDTSGVPEDLWIDLHQTGYMHPECHEALRKWHNAMEAGQVPEVRPL